jgi:hypothetical protein
MREEIDALQKKYPKTLEVVYVVDKASENWKGASTILFAGSPQCLTLGCDDLPSSLLHRSHWLYFEGDHRAARGSCVTRREGEGVHLRYVLHFLGS